MILASLLDAIDPAASSSHQDGRGYLGTWAEKTIASGEARLQNLDSSSHEAGVIRDMLVVLGEDKQVLASVGKKTFVAMTTHLALGDQNAARRSWIAGASFNDAMDGLAADRDAVNAKIAQNAAMHDEVVRVALRLLQVGGKAALALLLAAIGV